jgi:hypothetical protein
VGTRPFSQYDLFGSCESTQRHSSETRISLSRLCVTYAPIYYTIPLDFEYRISKISLHPRDHLCNFHPNVSGGASKEARGRVGERQSSRIKGCTCANPDSPTRRWPPHWQQICLHWRLSRTSKTIHSCLHQRARIITGSPISITNYSHSVRQHRQIKQSGHWKLIWLRQNDVYKKRQSLGRLLCNSVRIWQND